MKKIIIDLLDNGEVHIETTGFQGPTCVEETQFLKDFLGRETFKRLIPAYFVRVKNKIIKKYLQLCG